MRKRLVAFFILIIVFGTANGPVATADMTCSQGYVQWILGYPYCYPSSILYECLYCSVSGGGAGGHAAHPIP